MSGGGEKQNEKIANRAKVMHMFSIPAFDEAISSNNTREAGIDHLIQ